MCYGVLVSLHYTILHHPTYNFCAKIGILTARKDYFCQKFLIMLKIEPGDKVAVIGCGGVGINVVQFAAFLGAEVIAIDLQQPKLELAKELGATHIINPNTWDQDFEDICFTSLHIVDAFFNLKQGKPPVSKKDNIRIYKLAEDLISTNDYLRYLHENEQSKQIN